MEKVHIFRTRQSAHGTEGVLSCDGLLLFTLELPWKENQSNISCIPSGDYMVKPRVSPKFGETYHVQEVEDRSYILIHQGNFAGDKEKDLKTHVQGCILLGRKRGVLGGQRAVLSSRLAVNDFKKYMGKKSFQLQIHESF